MNILKVKLENCYGIKNLEHIFDFSQCCTQIIYAPNGAMKSSFAKVFDDICKGGQSRDRVFTNREPAITIRCNEDNSELLKESVFVVERYKEDIRYERVSTLLVNKQLKDEYDAILANIEDKKNHLIKNLQGHSGLKANCIDEICSAFNKPAKDILECLEHLAGEINDGIEVPYSDIKYKEIFNEKVSTFLKTRDFKSKLDDYLDTYDALVSKSTYFRKGVFTHNNADTVSRSLKENGFFKAAHTVSLNSGETKKELTNQEELEREIQSEKNKILTDDELTKKFQAMDDAITKNAELKNFRAYLEANPHIRPELRDLDEFKQKLWLSYLKVEIVLFNELIELFQNGKLEIAHIVEQAKNEQAAWKSVVEIFNNRFKVPYKLLVRNQEDVILHNAVPSIVFEYHDGDEKREIGGADLIQILSTGEQRALYLLNILFEIEFRRNLESRSLLIIDDIADSFDYRNKYAIVEYLRDMSTSGKFRMIILTHNFDFYRTVIGRLEINKWNNTFLTVKSDSEVVLINGKDSLQVFGSLKSKYHEDDSKLITAIPFVRNLVEYTIGTGTKPYLLLTALLHFKTERQSDEGLIKGTADIIITDLEEIFNDIFRVNIPIPNPTKSVYELIKETASRLCEMDEEGINLEDKIVLSIAIRLAAEVFMIREINDNAAVQQIRKDQTVKLFKLYCAKFPNAEDAISVLNRVNIMTPENIHLNSFMYEPLLDLSDHHLRKLYLDVLAMSENLAPLVVP